MASSFEIFSLEGKRALITGATGGIGGGIARIYAARGARVILHGRRRDVLEQLAAELGERASVYACELGDVEALDKMGADIIAEHGGIDILVNNAGLTSDGLSLNLPLDSWQRVLDVNLTGVFRLTQKFLRPMIKQRWGRIIMIGSVVGFTGNKGQSNYVAAKAGLVGLVKSLAKELASRSITVNCIAPGFIDTAMTADLASSVKDRILETIPVGRYGEASDIASAALYFASNESSYTTGQTLHVNGGLAMY